MGVENNITVLDAAMEYISLGWSIFPVWGGADPSRAKEPVLSLTPHWSRESTDDLKQITAWFAGTDYGIGLDCGKSGVFVMDGDRPELAEGVPLEGAWTMRGNPERMSWVFKGHEVGCGTWPAGEVKGEGGYVVLPPSYHPVGGRYVWLDRSGSMEPPFMLMETLRKASDKGEPPPHIHFMTGGEPCARTASVAARWAGLVASGEGSRYAYMVSAAYEIAALGAEGHRGAAKALREIKAAYLEAVKGDRTTGREEWRRAVTGLTLNLRPGKRERCRGNLCGVPEDLDTEFDEKVAESLRRLRINQEARRLLKVDEALWAPLGAQTLDALEAMPKIPEKIEGLLMSGGMALVAAQRKTGKTTLMTNVVRSLLDGEPLFDRFPTAPSKRVGLFDLEMQPAMLAEWLGRVGIRHRGNLAVYPAVGVVGQTFAAMMDGTGDFQEWLKGEALDILIVDPIAPLLASLGIDENHNGDIRRFLLVLRETCHYAGIREIILTHHTGWGATNRSRGAAAFEDTADVIWRLQRDGRERTFSAIGRLGEIEEEVLALDEATGLLSLQGEPSHEEEEAANAIIDVLADKAGEWVKATGLFRAAGLGHSSKRRAAQAALHSLVAKGRILKREGKAEGRYEYAYNGEYTTEGFLRDLEE